MPAIWMGAARDTLTRRVRFRLQAQRAGRPGTAMVEFGLVAPLLFLFMFAIIEFSLAIHTQIDYGNAISTGIRTATILGQDNVQNPQNRYTDDEIGYSLLGIDPTSYQSNGTMRGDDPRFANWYQLTLIESRTLNTTDLFQNTYKYSGSTRSFDLDPYDYLQTAYGASAPSACAYFYEAHEVTGVVEHDLNGAATTTTENVYYLDAAEKIQISPTNYYPDVDSSGNQVAVTPDPASHYPVNSLINCIDSTPGRSYSYGGSLPTLLCDSGSGTDAAFLGHTGNLCYYYPNERTNSIDGSAEAQTDAAILPDLVELSVNYTYRPFGTTVSSLTPLGLGFTITDHARGRLEPMTKFS
jgi:Flp pilus assembly protein TadG